MNAETGRSLAKARNLARANWAALTGTFLARGVGVRVIALGLILLNPAGGAAAATTQQPPPMIFFTDLDSGPNSGGETVNGYSGAYVTIYGNNFGASQGTSTITWNGLNCLRVLPATNAYTGWGMSHLWYQKIIVQLGSSCAAETGNFAVTVNGQASNGEPFTVRPGRIYFISPSGNQPSGVGANRNSSGAVTHALDHMRAGDTVYLKGGVNNSSGGSFAALDWAIQGKPGSPVAMVAYPGASPQPFIGGANPQSGNAVRCNSGYSTPNCVYATVAGIKMQANTSALWMEFGGDHWRVIANDLTCPNGDGQQGCFTTNQIDYVYFYGNYIHDVSSQSKNSSKQYHSVYFSTDSNHIWVGWNKWFNNYSCRDLQFHSSPLQGGGTGDPTGHNQYDLHVHDNSFDGNRCNAINFATIDPSQGPVEAFNNLIINVGTGPDSYDGTSSYTAIYMPNITNGGKCGSGTVEIYNNTLWNDGNQMAYGFPGGFFENDATSNMTMDLRNNIAYASQPATLYISHFNSGAIAGSNNLWYGSNSSPPNLKGNLTSNPEFMKAGADFHPSSSSPANGAGTPVTSNSSYHSYAVWGGIGAFDHDGLVRPLPPSIGAYDFLAASPVHR